MSSYYPVRLNTIRKDEKLAFDVFVPVGERYVQYIRAQDEFEGERIDRLKSKGVRKLFIPAGQEQDYLRYLENALDSLANDKVSISDRTKLAHDTLVTAAENAVKNLESEVGFKQQKKQLSKITQFLVSDRKIIKEIMQNFNAELDNNHHAANVSSLSVAVAEKLGITDKADLFDLSMAALLHDVGKQRFKENYDALGESMTQQQLQQYRAHVSDGISLLQEKPFINPRILGLIASHEELGRGRGYPEKKDVFKLPEIYQILILCNRFDHFHTHQQLPTLQALDIFFERHANDFSDELVTVLASVLT